MNEGAKTGIYWAVALVMLVIAIAVTRPPQTENPTEPILGQPLFPTFTDPLAASILRITSLDDSQDQLVKFEVAKDETTGVWSLPSRNNYPADAAEQMKDAANALVNVKVLDIQTDDPSLHSDLGVVEPNGEKLEAGEDGLGRLVVLKGQNNTTLASIIIGKPVKGREGQRYVRVPGQDPVYVVAINDKALSTNFADWIEKDLLQLSSIDISDVELQNYDAALEMGNQLALDRHYDAKVSVDGSSNWKLDSLVVYDDAGLKKDAKLDPAEKLSVTKLNALKNALDDLKIVDVASKPKGMSESLKADKDLVSDQQAVLSLASRGFFPVTQGDILSANGEMQVTLRDGVQYVLRFGNIKGMEEAKKEEGTESEKGTEEKTEAVGSNRYLLVTARVDESKFPPPELASIPKTVEELEEMEAKANDPSNPPAEVPESAASADPAAADKDMTPEAATESDEAAPSAETPADAPEKSDAPKDAAAEATAPEDKASGSEPADAASPEGNGSTETEQTGEGTATGSGQGLEADDEASAEAEATPTPTDEAKAADSEAKAADSQPADDKPADDKPADNSANEPKPADATETTSTADAAADKPMSDDASADAKGDEAASEETLEEKQERLESVQEKLTKENQRKLDERKDRLEAARRRVRELNGRFAAWYYVIPEDTYRKLRLSREELIEKPVSATLPGEAADDAAQAPSFSLPGLSAE